jgi:hypothetical protein
MHTELKIRDNQCQQSIKLIRKGRALWTKKKNSGLWDVRKGAEYASSLHDDAQKTKLSVFVSRTCSFSKGFEVTALYSR